MRRDSVISWLLPPIVALLLLFSANSCSKDVPADEPDFYGTWIDTVDGMVYRTLRLGDQIWMADNINRGEMIPGTRDQSDNGTMEKYCYDDNTVLCEKYGGLYQWGEAVQYSATESSRGICPDGWHIPSDSEWKILEIFLGMADGHAGELLWRTLDQGRTIHSGSETGFEALMGGNRFLTGSFNHIGSAGYFWTSSEAGDRHAWRRGIGRGEQGIYRATNHMDFGFSVRCVKY